MTVPRGSGVRLALAGAAFFPLLALLAPLLAIDRPWLTGADGKSLISAPIPYDPTVLDLERTLQPPGKEHWLGTDDLGRDVLSRLIHGSRVSVAAGLLASSLALLLGAVLGAAAGVRGGFTDRAVIYLIDVVQAFPALVLVLLGAAFLRPSFLVASLLIAFTGWTDAARLVRAEARRLRSAPFVEAARASGASALRVLLIHVLPEAVRPAFATAPYVLGAAVVTEASLSFLGLGTSPPTPSWGRSLADARGTLTEAWWCVLPPAVALFLFVFAVRHLGDAVAERRRVLESGASR